VRNKAPKISFVSIIFPAVLVLIWHLVSVTGKAPEYMMPSPIKLIFVMFDFVTGSLKLTSYSGTFFAHSIVSLGRVLSGFIIALTVGLPLGLITGRLSCIYKIIDPTINAVRSIPGIGWLPIAMVWFGVGTKTAIFLISLAGFFPIYLNSVAGAKSVPVNLIKAGKMLGARHILLFCKIILPWSMPSIFTGMRLALGISWAYLVLGELTGVNSGLGAVMMDARMLGHVDIIIISMICIAFWGKLTDEVLKLLMRVFFPTLGDDKI